MAKKMTSAMEKSVMGSYFYYFTKACYFAGLFCYGNKMTCPG